MSDYIYPPNISRQELLNSETAIKKGIDNIPVSTEIEKNLVNLAYFLQELRNRLTKHYKKPCYIVITSGYRCMELNSLIGSSIRSAHLYGLAADFKVPGLTTKQISEFICEHCADMYFDQCIDEYETWTHIGIKKPKTLETRRQFITPIKNKNGRVSYVPTPYLSSEEE